MSGRLLPLPGDLSCELPTPYILHTEICILCCTYRPAYCLQVLKTALHPTNDMNDVRVSYLGKGTWIHGYLTSAVEAAPKMHRDSLASCRLISFFLSLYSKFFIFFFSRAIHSPTAQFTKSPVRNGRLRETRQCGCGRHGLRSLLSQCRADALA